MDLCPLLFLVYRTGQEAVAIPVSGTAFPDCTAWSDLPCQVCGLSVGASAGAFVGAVQKIRKKSSRKMRKGR